jgi:hypothetical protein
VTVARSAMQYILLLRTIGEDGHSRKYTGGWNNKMTYSNTQMAFPFPFECRDVDLLTLRVSLVPGRTGWERIAALV